MFSYQFTLITNTNSQKVKELKKSQLSQLYKIKNYFHFSSLTAQKQLIEKCFP